MAALLATALAAVTFLLPALAAPPLNGAIFTTTVDGSIVNENVRYEAKEDVYLDGGPGPNAPSTAAGLPAGDYYFQVTDPSGKDLLSSDAIECRRITVNENGVISAVVPGTTWVKDQGKWTLVPCQHAQGVDIDHAALGAITVQLYPYDDTPNPGGVYKVWVTPVDDYTGSSDCAEGENGSCNVNGENWTGGNAHGFIPAASKTDNYKVDKKGKPFESPEITVQKFHDANLNGIWDEDEGEEEVSGWTVTVVDPSAVSNDVFTPALVLAAEAGDYSFTEETPDGTIQTALIVDGTSQLTVTANTSITVEGVSGETHNVIFGNAGIGDVTVCKIFDRNGNGQTDEGEPGVAGWLFELTGTTAAGQVSGSGYTDETGCVTFEDLLPGSYAIAEVIPAGGDWMVTGIATQTLDLVSSLSGSVISGQADWVIGSGAFHNTCTDVSAGFGTKGFWHNKNGLALITQDMIDYVNTLAPYSTASDYFDLSDEPFDGLDGGGNPVPSAYNNEDVAPIAGEGTAWAEISHFLTEDNGGGTHREQLAQQLLAFIFNVQVFLGGEGVAIQLGDGSFIEAGDLIQMAIDIWSDPTSTVEEITGIKSVLDALNNTGEAGVPGAGPVIIPENPCAVVY